MKQYEIIFDVSTKEFTKTESATQDLMLAIGFRTNGQLPVAFTELAFGYRIKDGTTVLEQNTYPLGGQASYVKTYEHFISYDNIQQPPGSTRTLEIWVDHAGESFSVSYEVVLPKPEKPFDSWIWNDVTYVWEAPVPHPQHPSVFYNWDEVAGAWVRSSKMFITKLTLLNRLETAGHADAAYTLLESPGNETALRRFNASVILDVDDTAIYNLLSAIEGCDVDAMLAYDPEIETFNLAITMIEVIAE